MFALIVESGCTNAASADTRFCRYSAPVSAVLITVSHTIQNLLNKRTGTLNFIPQRVFLEKLVGKFIAFLWNSPPGTAEIHDSSAYSFILFLKIRFSLSF